MAIVGAIAGIIGAGIALYNVFASSSANAQATSYQQEANANNYAAQAAGYQTQALQTEVQIDQTKSNISAYEDYLSAFPNYAELQKNSFETQAKSTFEGLLSNYEAAKESASAVDAASGASGRSGATMALFADKANVQAGKAETGLMDYAGTDKVLGGSAGGMYQQGKDELYHNLDTTQKQYQSQLDIYKTSLGTLQQSLDLTKKNAVDMQTAADRASRVAKAEQLAAATWWNPFD
jgi:hypothetical protein